MNWPIALLLAAPLLSGCTSTSDGDGLDAGAEEGGWGIRVLHADGSIKDLQVTSDPTLADTDGDGIDDFQEFLKGSDPRVLDTDGDGLADGPLLCPEAGTALASAVLSSAIVEHPERPGCFLGEGTWEYQGVRISTNPASAHTDSGSGIDDTLADGEEILGWDVTAAGRTYHVFSNPSVPLADTDNDGVHDGHEKRLGLDPQAKDTDLDTLTDLEDAAPLGNLVIEVTIERVNLKTDEQVTGGARLRVDASAVGVTASAGPKAIAKGQSTVNMVLRLDVPDRATGFSPEGPGAGVWLADVVLEFWHDGTASDEPVRVRSGTDGHRLTLHFNAFDGTWTGGAGAGQSSGPDADVRLDLRGFVE